MPVAERDLHHVELPVVGEPLGVRPEQDRRAVPGADVGAGAELPAAVELSVVHRDAAGDTAARGPGASGDGEQAVADADGGRAAQAVAEPAGRVVDGPGGAVDAGAVELVAADLTPLLWRRWGRRGRQLVVQRGRRRVGTGRAVRRDEHGPGQPGGGDEHQRHRPGAVRDPPAQAGDGAVRAYGSVRVPGSVRASGPGARGPGSAFGGAEAGRGGDRPRGCGNPCRRGPQHGGRRRRSRRRRCGDLRCRDLRCGDLRCGDLRCGDLRCRDLRGGGRLGRGPRRDRPGRGATDLRCRCGGRPGPAARTGHGVRGEVPARRPVRDDGAGLHGAFRSVPDARGRDGAVGADGPAGPRHRGHGPRYGVPGGGGRPAGRLGDLGAGGHARAARPGPSSGRPRLGRRHGRRHGGRPTGVGPEGAPTTDGGVLRRVRAFPAPRHATPRFLHASRTHGTPFGCSVRRSRASPRLR